MAPNPCRPSFLPLALRIRGRKAFVTRMVPHKLMSATLWYFSTLVNSTSPKEAIPALFTKPHRPAPQERRPSLRICECRAASSSSSPQGSPSRQPPEVTCPERRETHLQQHRWPKSWVQPNRAGEDQGIHTWSPVRPLPSSARCSRPPWGRWEEGPGAITLSRVLQPRLHVSEGKGHLLFAAHVQLEDVHPLRAQAAQLLGAISSLVLSNRQGEKP